MGRQRIRKFLNGKFLEKFSPAEKSKIVEVSNQNPGNPWYAAKAVSTGQSQEKKAVSGDPKGGNLTQDKIFLLSIEEACSLFGDSSSRLKNKGFTQQGKSLKPDDPKYQGNIIILRYPYTRLIVPNEHNFVFIHGINIS
jgi:hypothetical protein